MVEIPIMIIIIIIIIAIIIIIIISIIIMQNLVHQEGHLSWLTGNKETTVLNC